MAARKQYGRNTRKNQSQETKGSQTIVIFWLLFLIVIIFVFMINAQTIKKNFDLFMTRLTNSPLNDNELPLDNEGAENGLSQDGTSGVTEEGTHTGGTANSNQIVVITDNTQTVEPERQAEQTHTENTTPPVTQTQTQTPRIEDTRAEAMRERNIYFTQIDKDGQILQSRVIRRVPVSETPMMDVLNIMLDGPSTDEINRGILNLIPNNTRLLSATVRGSTAYLSFSEDFLFNTFGVEGYVAQLRQIVWTVTEFSNVADVQILLEGRRIDYLGEGIYIGSPISRQSF